MNRVCWSVSRPGPRPTPQGRIWGTTFPTCPDWEASPSAATHRSAIADVPARPCEVGVVNIDADFDRIAEVRPLVVRRLRDRRRSPPPRRAGRLLRRAPHRRDARAGGDAIPRSQLGSLRPELRTVDRHGAARVSRLPPPHGRPRLLAVEAPAQCGFPRRDAHGDRGEATRRVVPRDLRGLSALAEERVFQTLLLVSEDRVETMRGAVRRVPWQTFVEELWSDRLLR
jgi:hypothetical protein